MLYLLKRGPGARRRRAHLCLHDPLTGQPVMRPVCGQVGVEFNMTSNMPWGRPTCKHCLAAAAHLARAGAS